MQPRAGDGGRSVGVVMFGLAIASVVVAWLAFGACGAQLDKIYCRHPEKGETLGPVDAVFAPSAPSSCSSMTSPSNAVIVILENVLLALRTLLLIGALGTSTSFVLYSLSSSSKSMKTKSFSRDIVLLVATAVAQVPSIMAYGIVASDALAELAGSEDVAVDALTSRGLFHGDVTTLSRLTTASFALNVSLLVFGHALAFALKNIE